jgi:hypothetical protein
VRSLCVLASILVILAWSPDALAQRIDVCARFDRCACPDGTRPWQIVVARVAPRQGERAVREWAARLRHPLLRCTIARGPARPGSQVDLRIHLEAGRAAVVSSEATPGADLLIGDCAVRAIEARSAPVLTAPVDVSLRLDAVRRHR